MQPDIDICIGIDIVYRWLNPNSVKREAKKRYRDNDELRYSLRSLSLLTYVNNVFIIARGDPPKWLKIDNPNLYWINEETIDHPLKSQIPQDSEFAKYIIQDIPELGEFFLIMDDDYYIGKSVPLDYWFKDNDIPIWPHKVYMKHTPLPMRKSLYKEAMDRIFIQNNGCAIRLSNDKIFQFEVERSRFRFDPFIAMKVYLATNHKIENAQRDHIQITSRNKSYYDKLINHATYCINDMWDEDDKKYKEEMKKYNKYRNNRYPNKSEFE